MGGRESEGKDVGKGWEEEDGGVGWRGGAFKQRHHTAKHE